ncbi:MAG: hypothetical protein RQ862_03400 [Candidatus Caldarchaeales archaeon]|jgi:hypothetical protein|nr:hypothetical protein [Candidatus Caldarchaeales archaeon]
MPLKKATICRIADIISRKVAEVGFIKNTTYRVWLGKTSWGDTREWHIDISGYIDAQRVDGIIIVFKNNRAIFYEAILSDYKPIFFGKQHTDDLAAVTAVLLVGDFFARPFQQQYKI